jgi:hypothetical protein
MEMKNICGKIPVELHEKLKLEVEELGISIPKYLEMVIEEHMTRKGEKANMADLRTVAVQVTEDLFSRLKAVLARNGMKQKDLTFSECILKPGEKIQHLGRDFFLF